MTKWIKKAACKYQNNLYIGWNHGECFKLLPKDANFVNTEQGFITNEDVFVNRIEACKIAIKAGQIRNTTYSQLISEELCFDWLRRQEKELDKIYSQKAQTAWVIMRDDGEYFERVDYFGEPLFTDNIQNANWLNEDNINKAMNDLSDYDVYEFCKPVEIEIRVKGE